MRKTLQRHNYYSTPNKKNEINLKTMKLLRAHNPEHPGMASPTPVTGSRAVTGVGGEVGAGEWGSFGNAECRVQPVLLGLWWRGWFSDARPGLDGETWSAVYAILEVGMRPAPVTTANQVSPARKASSAWPAPAVRLPVLLYHVLAGQCL